MHIEPPISDAVSRMSGCQVSTARQLQLELAVDAGYLKEVAIRRRAIILTRDRDFVDSPNFPPGEPPGILRLDLPGMPPSEVIVRLQAFLTSGHRGRCKKSVVILGNRTAEIRERRGKRVTIDTVAYFQVPGELDD